ncbi:MAG: hypothetical protein WBQ25_20445 [Nitrososphaeraceae archaeon]
MQKSNTNYRIISGIFIATILSIGITTNGITKVLAQTNPLNPSQGSNQASMSGMNMTSTAGGGTNKTTVTRDTITLLLEGKSIPGKGFLHLYDSTPYLIMNGHIALHVPCDSDSKPIVNTLIGSAPDVKPVEQELIKELSQPGNMCLYHVDVGSDIAKKIIQTDIAIQNPSNQTITFPPSSGITIGVNEIMPGAPG